MARTGGSCMSGKDEEEICFISEYLRYTSDQESPDEFHFWTASTILATALGRKCYMKRGYYTLYPNLFTILVAGSAKCRKSTALGIGVPLLRDVGESFVINGKITPEALIKEIASVSKVKPDDPNKLVCPDVLVYSSELSVLLTKQSYGEPIIHILTDLFDCPDSRDYKTKNSGIFQLNNVFVCILAATTPTGVAKGIPESALEEGFASRILFVYRESTDKVNAFPVLTKEQEQLYEDLKKLLHKRGQMRGEFMLTKEAHDWFKTWYEETWKNEEPLDKRLEGFHGRKPDHLMREAMILAGSRGRKVLNLDILQASLMAIEQVEQSARGAFREIGSDILTQHLARMRIIVKHHKIIDHSTLLRKMYPVTARQLEELLATAFGGKWMMRDPNKPYIYMFVQGLD
jgi:hypothetical protein